MEKIIIFIQDHSLQAVGILAALKLLHLVIYRGFVLEYIIFNFFKIYSRMDLRDKSPLKRQFRRMHNILTYAFYFIFFTWLLSGIMIGFN